MALKVKDVTTSTRKWGDNAARASEEYSRQAAAAGETWVTNAARAEDNYGAAISSPGIKRRFAAGIRKAGSAEYTAGITEKGATRFPQGIGVSGGKYSSGVEPFLSTLASLTLSARKPRGDPGNLMRVTEVTRALNAKRLAMLGVGS